MTLIRRRQKKYSEVQLLKLRDLGRLIICQKYGTSFVHTWFPQSSTDGASGCNQLSLFFAHTRQIWYALYSLLKKEGLLHDFQFCLLMASNKTTKVHSFKISNFLFIYTDWLIDWLICLVDIHKCFYILSNDSNLFTLLLKAILSVREEIDLKWKKTA